MTARDGKDDSVSDKDFSRGNILASTANLYFLVMHGPSIQLLYTFIIYIYIQYLTRRRRLI